VLVQLKVLGSLPLSCPAAIVAQSGNWIVLRSSAPVATGALVEAQVGEQMILGEVVHSRALKEGVEIFVEARHSLPQSWQPHPAWQGVDAPESVLESLCALNERLLAFGPSDAPVERPPSRRPVGN